MFDQMEKSNDATMVATPDNTLSGVVAHTNTLGKYAYIQKLLIHSVYESRLLAKLTEKYKVVTQLALVKNIR